MDKYSSGSRIKGILPKKYGNSTKFAFKLYKLEVKAATIEVNNFVDVLDPEKCWVRGKVKAIASGQVSTEVNGKEVSYKLEAVKPCGAKLKEIPCPGGSGPKKFQVTFQNKNNQARPRGFNIDSGDLARERGDYF